MCVCAAVMTGKGTSAIATIGVFGPSAPTLLARIFQPLGPPLSALEPGRIWLGNIVREGIPIDQVILGCEAPHLYMIHCHGNPLIVKKTMELLKQCQTQLVPAEQMHCQVWRSQGLNTLSIEGRLALLQARTLEGTRIIMRQMNGGLTGMLCAWQEEMESLSVKAIQEQARSILDRSKIAHRIIYGCKAVLMGPPNTGKSTLLNALLGQDKAIVADVEGTTRDWIEVSCRLDSLYLTLIDTAGLHQGLRAVSDVDRMSQHRTLDVLDQADLVIVVLDASDSARQIDTQVMHKIQDKCAISVLNKSDLAPASKPMHLPQTLGPVLEISAKQETGILALKQSIRQTLGIDGFHPDAPVCFTERQSHLLAEIQGACTKKQIRHIIDVLLNALIEDVDV
jgi:tRNA modification GTPase